MRSPRLLLGKTRTFLFCLLTLTSGFYVPPAAAEDAAGVVTERVRFDPAAEPVPLETLTARRKFFGAENVHPTTGAVPRGEVHLSWVSVTTFVAAMDGHVVLLDTYIHKGEEEENYVPATVQDLIDVKPEFIILGHGHFDHAARAGEIAQETGAKIVGTAQHCRDQIEARGLLAAEYCQIVFDENASFGDSVAVPLWDGICATGILHPHSEEQLPDPDHPVQNRVMLPIPEPNNPLIHPPGPSMLAGLNPAGDEGGVVMYQFRIGHFSMLYHDSSGPLPEVTDQQAVEKALRALPPTDVQVGAIIGFNQITNGMRDPGIYADAVQPKVFIPTHHDFVFEYGASRTLKAALQQEFEYFGVEPDLRFIQEPYDYVRPNLLRFDVAAPLWRGPAAEACPAASGST